MKIIIARHGQTNENLEGVNSGQESEVLLNEEGRDQAKKLASFLKKENITFAYVSPQSRAVQTAEHILKHHPEAKVVSSHYLKEQHLGVLEGKKEEWKNIKKESKDPFHLIKPEGGESYHEVQKRAKDFFGGVVANHKNDTVLIVSHAGTIGMMILDVLRKPITKENYDLHRPENTAFTVLEFSDDNSFHVKFLNDTRHLS